MEHEQVVLRGGPLGGHTIEGHGEPVITKELGGFAHRYVRTEASEMGSGARVYAYDEGESGLPVVLGEFTEEL